MAASKQRYVMTTPSVQEDSTVRIVADFQHTRTRGKEEYDTNGNDLAVED